MTEENEKSLVFQYRLSKHKVAEIEDALKAAKADEQELEHRLLEHLEAIGADSTATYEGVRISVQKPRLYASYLKDNEAFVFDFVTDVGRSDLIKPTINASSLSAWVKERIEAGQNVPEFINFYLKPMVRIQEK